MTCFYTVVLLQGDRGVEVLRRYAEARREKLPLRVILVRVSDAIMDAKTGLVRNLSMCISHVI